MHERAPLFRVPSGPRVTVVALRLISRIRAVGLCLSAQLVQWNATRFIAGNANKVRIVTAPEWVVRRT